jgi:hypothetical protein
MVNPLRPNLLIGVTEISVWVCDTGRGPGRATLKCTGPSGQTPEQRRLRIDQHHKVEDGTASTRERLLAALALAQLQADPSLES